jgi:hypothetical protein
VLNADTELGRLADLDTDTDETHEMNATRHTVHTHKFIQCQMTDYYNYWQFYRVKLRQRMMELFIA